MTKTVLQEIQDGEVSFKTLGHKYEVYVTKSGQDIMVSFYTPAVLVNHMKVTWWQGWKIKRALRKVMR